MRHSVQALRLKLLQHASVQTYAGSRQYQSASVSVTVPEALEAIAKRNPELNVFASHIALAQVSASKPGEGPLEGWPIAVKANIATALPSVTSCASHALGTYTSPFQATVVDSLERAGAVVVGKTNMDEFGMGSKNMFSIYGPALNPHTPASDAKRDGPTELDHHTPGGSSGGSAAAVAAGMCRVALGSDTGGSVRLPAAWCGVVGFKPTFGRISRHGLVAYGSSLDTVGIIARDVADVQSVFGIAAVPDPLDMTCMSSSLRARIKALTNSRPWTTAALERSESESAPLTGIRVGIPEEYWVDELSEPALESWRAGANRLAALGCDVVSVSLPHTPSALPTYYALAWAEASSNLARYDGIRYGHRSGIRPDTRDLQNASQKYANTRGEGFGAEVQRRILLGTYVMSSAASEHYFTPSQKIRRLIQEEFDNVFALPNALSVTKPLTLATSRPPGVDVLLFPTATGAAPRLGDREYSRVASYVNDVMTVPASLAGIPAISIPAGHTDGMPLGLQLVAQYGDDDLLLCMARHL
ncbi:Trimeric GatFAB AmidoTransferase(AdT) complex subunit [Coemansia sp. RSA 2050]|nr:Trimeric GatFAB AmidoTransferase(AdT) complex subunit [Coemansia sp. RSA 2050]KAJ2730321.1 Trimeric GatFAB AmidoTransferase(AdT) complex subunit [Coemansia sp. BCRC 34962]